MPELQGRPTVAEVSLGALRHNCRRVRELAAAARAAARSVPVHVKIDTGMTRLGLDVGGVSEFGAFVGGLAGLEVAGVFSHFASADAVDTAEARAQTARFAGAVEALAASG